MNNTFVFRCDANEKIGAGHVMRCLALAQQCINFDHPVIFVMTEPNQLLESRLQNEGITIQNINSEPGSKSDAHELLAIAKKYNTEWIILDGYHFDDHYQHTVKESNLNLLCIDDYGHAKTYYSDIILNQNCYADENLYPNHQPQTKMLLGTKYVLLRNEFLHYEKQSYSSDETCKIIVTLGGGDPFNITTSVINALLPIPGIKVKAVVGPYNPHMNQLQTLVSSNHENFELLQHVSEMPALMDWADISINAGGSTCYELLYSDVFPIVITWAENQVPVAKSLAEKEYVHYLGWYETVEQVAITSAVSNYINKDERRDRSNNHEIIVDGLGSQRVYSQINNEGLFLRPATEQDTKLLFDWANDPTVRQNSFSPDSIEWHNHQTWFQSRLHDPDTKIWIAENQQAIPIGQMRLEKQQEKHLIDVSISPHFRGQGYGTTLIKQASQRALSEDPSLVLNAYVKQSNTASILSFQNAGYQTVQNDSNTNVTLLECSHDQ